MKYVILAFAILTSTAHAQDAIPLDLNSVDRALVKDFLGTYLIENADGKKTCEVKLTRKETIGGMVIKVAPSCAKTFPIMDDVASWRLYENWEIALADATRHQLIRFTTPDNEYVADPETDGISTIRKKQ